MDHRELMRYAYDLALNSPDPSTQNGAVLVGAGGDVIGRACNTNPPGVRLTAERLIRPLKYQILEHAESGAILDAAKHGKATDGSTLYCPWAACPGCARAIICAGVTTVFTHRRLMNRTEEREDWKAQVFLGLQMLVEKGVLLRYVEEEFPECKPILFAEKLWQP